MIDSAIKTYSDLEDTYWWFIGRRFVIEQFLRTYIKSSDLEILDWGCGPGGNFPLLKKFGSVLGIDASAKALELCRQKNITTVIKADTLDDFKSDRQFNLVTCFDVFEHIEDDASYLKKLSRVIKADGHVLVTVPAYQFLWSELDVYLGHKRRYNRKQIEGLFAQNGYEVIRSSYFISFLAIPIIVFRFLGWITGRAKKPQFTFVQFPNWLNKFFTSLILFESKLIKYICLPFGTSIIILARKK